MAMVVSSVHIFRKIVRSTYLENNQIMVDHGFPINMKKAPLRPTNLQKLQKPVGLTRKPTKPETLPIVDQILILKARFLQIEICLENVRNDEELEEKKLLKLFGTEKGLTLAISFFSRHPDAEYKNSQYGRKNEKKIE